MEKTRIKLCGLSRVEDVETANRLLPEYVGFVFAKKSKRCVSPEQAAALKARLHKDILAVGVFTDEDPEVVADLLERGTIDLAQLHGREDEAYIAALRLRTSRPLIQAFRIKQKDDLLAAAHSTAEYVLLDAGQGDGKAFDWKLAADCRRPYFLAGGLHPDNVSEALRLLHPFAVDASSGLETEGRKDPAKMEAFVQAVRNAGRKCDR